jgi:hypothetical protein
MSKPWTLAEATPTRVAKPVAITPKDFMLSGYLIFKMNLMIYSRNDCRWSGLYTYWVRPIPTSEVTCNVPHLITNNVSYPRLTLHFHTLAEHDEIIAVDRGGG